MVWSRETVQWLSAQRYFINLLKLSNSFLSPVEDFILGRNFSLQFIRSTKKKNCFRLSTYYMQKIVLIYLYS